jgi:mono/diheme cytochrome c family protein
MKIVRAILPAFLFAVAMVTASLAGSSSQTSQKPAVQKQQDEAAMLLEGEQRFKTNCGRCHMPPHKFPPRMMATIIRHMRVRATLTDEDMRLILRFMTQ